MADYPWAVHRTGVIALGIWLNVAVLGLVAIVVFNNSWRIWNTTAFCGSYADFYTSPVAEVCLTVPRCFHLSLTHLLHVGPAIALGGTTAIGYLLQHRSISE